MDLKNLDLLSLQTQQMQDDITTQGLSAALEDEFIQLVNDVSLISMYANIDNMNTDILDELAYQMHLDYYDQTAEISVKRELIKAGIIIHRTKGTPYAVNKLIQTVFGDGYVQEWFDYGGEPYMFKVITTNPSITGEDADKFIKMLDSVKNARSHLEEILVALSGEMNLNLACVLHTGDNLTIRQVV